MNEIDLQRLLNEGIAAAKAVQREQKPRRQGTQKPVRRTAAARAAKQAQARQALLGVIELDEANIRAWLWLSVVVDDQTEKRICLEKVLALDPANQPARVGLARLDQPATRRSKSGSNASKTALVSKHVSGIRRASSQQTTAQAHPSANSPEDHPQAPALRLRPVLKSRQSLKNLKHSAHLAVEYSDRKTNSSHNAGAQTSCPFCRRSIGTIALRCPCCTLPLVVDCPTCGTQLDVEQKTCSQCGQQLGHYRPAAAYFARLARAYQAKQQHPQALKAWQVVEHLNPDYPDLNLHLGQAQAAAGRTQAAITCLRHLLAQKPGHLAATLALGEIFHQLHRWQEAQAIYDQALAANPASPQLHFALGWLLLEQEKLKAALPHLRKATRLDPQHGLAWWRLAQLYEQLQKPRSARRANRQALQVLPAGTLAFKAVQQQLQMFTPTLPPYMARSWTELGRQGVGPVFLCVLTAFLDAGLNPWWVPWTGWTAICLAVLGTFFWLSGTSLPQNALIRLLAGPQGLSSTLARGSSACMGASCWLTGLGVILYPLNQPFPEWPL